MLLEFVNKTLSAGAGARLKCSTSKMQRSKNVSRYKPLDKPHKIIQLRKQKNSLGQRDTDRAEHRSQTTDRSQTTSVKQQQCTKTEREREVNIPRVPGETSETN